MQRYMLHSLLYVNNMHERKIESVGFISCVNEPDMAGAKLLTYPFCSWKEYHDVLACAHRVLYSSLFLQLEY